MSQLDTRLVLAIEPTVPHANQMQLENFKNFIDEMYMNYDEFSVNVQNCPEHPLETNWSSWLVAVPHGAMSKPATARASVRDCDEKEIVAPWWSQFRSVKDRIRMNYLMCCYLVVFRFSFSTSTDSTLRCFQPTNRKMWLFDGAYDGHITPFSWLQLPPQEQPFWN